MNEPESQSFREVTGAVEAIGEQTEPTSQHWSEGITQQPAVERTMEEASSFIQRHPRGSLIGALSLGILVGLLAGRREPSFSERAIEQAKEKRGLWTGLLLGSGAIGALLRRFTRADMSDQRAHEMAQEVGRSFSQPRPPRAKRVFFRRWS